MYLFESYWTSTRTAQSHPSISFVYYSVNHTQSSMYKTLKRNVICCSLFDPRDENKNSKTLLHFYKTYPSISQIIICLLFEIEDGVHVISFIEQKTLIFAPFMTPGGKIKTLNPYCTSAKHMPSHILEYQLSSPENVDEVQVTNFT